MELTDQTPLPDGPGGALQTSRDQFAAINAELLLEGRRVFGEIRYTGVTRRLVDILNALEGPFLTMHAGALRDRSGNDLEFDRIQVARSSMLLAVPRQGSASRIDRGEVIQKSARLVTVALPGCEVSGYFHIAPGIDPSFAVISASNRFVPLTQATVTIDNSNDTQTFFESVALLNTAHVQAYVWSDPPESPTFSLTNEALLMDEGPERGSPQR